MATNVEVPSLGESVTEAILTQWLKAEGDEVAADEPICELESDKATVDLPAPAAGVLHRVKAAGETARVGEVIAEIKPLSGSDNQPQPAKQKTEQPENREIPKKNDEYQRKAKKQEQPKEQPPPGPEAPAEEAAEPAAAERAIEKKPTQRRSSPPPSEAAEGIRRVPMSKIRRSIADRLVRAQQTAAMLTTFNEIDMTAVQNVRKKQGERFHEAHGVSLGLTSFFARACALALKQFPNVNAQIDNGDILFHDYVNLGLAVSTERGLIVPVLRHVESLSLAQIESEIKRAAAAARDGKLSISDLSGGTFTITNGGIFGSLLSTPLLNPPQSGILGLHAIQERPVAISGQVEVRPMMYVALTYDHRLVDGRESVSFLVRVKQLIEDPLQIILEI
ncbi:MAG TPA: 2-oxoglutarate dehydrogenase complex dihydrolipoyllysine-residue succinyltransferase [Pirellulaceae bacterium]|nr:2-oxoglutarate dehydrogenase complex dihydrolipoyllysine-residue succinyltransferase [Pirellulaceae bacterium]